MIVIDMDIPKCCGTCRMSGTDVCNEWTNLKGYEMGQKRADTCPIKCDIEQIRAEAYQQGYDDARKETAELDSAYMKGYEDGKNSR